MTTGAPDPNQPRQRPRTLPRCPSTRSERQTDAIAPGTAPADPITGGSPDPTLLRPALSVVAGASLLSLSAIIVRTSDVHPVTVALCRCTIAMLALLPLAVRERRRRGGLTSRARVVCLVAGLALGCDYVAWASSIFRIGAGVSTVLINVQVIVLPALAWIVRRERVSRRFVAALPVIAIGLTLVAGLVGGHGHTSSDAVGLGLALLAGIGYGIYLFFSAAATREGAGALQALTVATGTAALTAALALPFTGGAHLSSMTPRGWMLMALLALLGQVLAWLLIHRGGAKLPSSTTGLLLLVQPPMAMLLAHVCLGEKIGPVQWVGVIVLVLGIGAATATS